MRLFSMSHPPLYEGGPWKTAFPTPHRLAKYPSTSEPRRHLVKHEDMIKTHISISARAYIVAAFAATGAALNTT